MRVSKSSWRNWSRDDWNEALFLHFFSDSDGEDHPVHRISVTPGELFKIVSDFGADPDDIQEAFLEVIRTSSHIEFNHRLSSFHIDSKIGWEGEEIPPFFVELAFSCLVASPPDGEIRSVGDFRNRLAMLLEHEEFVANYPLNTLAPLWRAFSRWLDVRRATGAPYRRLILPQIDHRVRIGYSINLAFPSRKDLLTLTEILSNNGIEEDPPIPTVFDLVGSAIRKFSTGFRKTYDEFREAFKSRVTNLENFPFWGAVREAVDSAIAYKIEEDRYIRSLKLVLEPEGVVLLLSTEPGDEIKSNVDFVKADTPYGEFGSVLCEGSANYSGFYQATLKLLQGQFRNVLNGQGWYAINIALEQGLLLFKKTESLSWELAFTRNEEEDYKALIKDYLKDVLLWGFPPDQRPFPNPSQYNGWSELEQFPGEWFRSLTYSEDSPLAKIRCLQPTVSRPRLSFIGGCPLDGGYLGIPNSLPMVRAKFCNSVQILPIGGKGEMEPIQLRRVDKNSLDFTFAVGLQNPLDGTYRVIGSHDGRVLVKKEVFFRPEIVVNAYASPTDPKAWEMESGGPDVVTYGEGINGVSHPNGIESQSTCLKSENAAATSCASVTLSQLKSTQPSWLQVDASEPQNKISGWNSCEFEKANRFMEICGGLAMRRKGIPEAELLDLVQDCLSVNQYDKKWDVVRAWMEGGYFDRLHFKNWRRAEYFPCIPRFVLNTQDGIVNGVLYGLATTAFRNRADVELLELGVKSSQIASLSRWVPPVPTWRALSTDPYVRVSRALGLEDPIWTKPIFDTLWSLFNIIASRGDPPQYYERQGCWDWDHGWFSRDTELKEEGVEVILYKRPDRPPFFQVNIDGEHVWWTTSRNWSLLLAHNLRSEASFALAGIDQVIRVSKGQVYLPLPVGRYLTMIGVTPPGPVSDRDRCYVYQFRDSKERQRLISSIWGGVQCETPEIVRWARWILAISKRPDFENGVRAIPPPSYIRRRLEQFRGIPEIRELCQTKIHPSLLPRLREDLFRFMKERGK